MRTARAEPRNFKYGSGIAPVGMNNRYRSRPDGARTASPRAPRQGRDGGRPGHRRRRGRLRCPQGAEDAPVSSRLLREDIRRQELGGERAPGHCQDRGHDPRGLDIRTIVASLCGSTPERLYEFTYCAPGGQAENPEHVRGILSSSCTRPTSGATEPPDRAPAPTRCVFGR